MTLAPHLPIKYGKPTGKPPTIPQEAKGVGHFFKSFDSRLWLFYRLWEPYAKNYPSNNNISEMNEDDEKDENDNEMDIQATLMILHGSGDHSGCYDELARSLNSMGVAVIALDMRGWGYSDGESMYFHDTDTFVEDLHTLYTRIHDLDPRYKNVGHRFLLGKGLGALITAYAVERHPSNWTGLLGLSGTYSIHPKMPLSLSSQIFVFVLKILSWFLPKLPILKPFANHGHRAATRWKNDKLCCKDYLRIGHGVELLRAMDALPSTLSHTTKLPLLLMSGGHDSVVALEGHKMMIDLHQCSDKSLAVYPHGRHHLLKEPHIKDQVIQDICGWTQLHIIVTTDGAGCGCARYDY